MMTSSTPSSSTSASSEARAFVAWSEALAIPRPLAERYARLDVRDTYHPLLHYRAASPFRGAEFSLRGGEPVHTARVAVAPRGRVALRELVMATGERQERVLAAADALPGVDFLVGCGERGTKLYVQRPHSLARDVFRRAATQWLRMADEAVPDDDELDFACVDLLPDGATAAKLYRVTGDRVRARAWLGESALADRLDELPDAQLVVSHRFVARAWAGVTLHARLFEAALPRLAAPLRRAFDGLAARSGRRLVPTHLSWSEPGGEQTLYYQVDAHA